MIAMRTVEPAKVKTAGELAAVNFAYADAETVRVRNHGTFTMVTCAAADYLATSLKAEVALLINQHRAEVPKQFVEALIADSASLFSNERAAGCLRAFVKTYDATRPNDTRASASSRHNPSS